MLGPGATRRWMVAAQVPVSRAVLHWPSQTKDGLFSRCRHVRLDATLTERALLAARSAYEADAHARRADWQVMADQPRLIPGLRLCEACVCAWEAATHRALDWAARSALEQGLATHVEDRAVLHRVAVLLGYGQ